MRCGVEQEGHTVRAGVAPLRVVTGGPVSTVAGPEATRDDGFATENATARYRHRAYGPPPVLGTVPSLERPVVADCGDVNKKF